MGGSELMINRHEIWAEKTVYVGIWIATTPPSEGDDNTNQNKRRLVNLVRCSSQVGTPLNLNLLPSVEAERFLAALDGVEAITVKVTDPGSRPRFWTDEGFVHGNNKFYCSLD